MDPTTYITTTTTIWEDVTIDCATATAESVCSGTGTDAGWTYATVTATVDDGTDDYAASATPTDMSYYRFRRR